MAKLFVVVALLLILSSPAYAWKTTSATAALAATTVVVASPNTGYLDLYSCYNPSNAVAYIQVFDALPSDTVTLNTTVPDFFIALPTLAAGNLSGMNLYFAKGIRVAATTTATGSTAPSAAVVCSFSGR